MLKDGEDAYTIRVNQETARQLEALLQKGQDTREWLKQHHGLIMAHAGP